MKHKLLLKEDLDNVDSAGDTAHDYYTCSNLYTRRIFKGNLLPIQYVSMFISSENPH